MSSNNNQRWDPVKYSKNARYVSDLGMPVVDLLDARPGERVLDLGCGDGALTVKLVELGCRVVGIDASPDMVNAARARRLDARRMDAADLPFKDEFDAVFSNAALHWMKHPEQVIESVFRALKPGGRFVGEFGGHGNIASILKALEASLSARGLTILCPWFFPRPEEYSQFLKDGGFVVKNIALFDRPTPLPVDMADWLEIFAQPFVNAVPSGDRRLFIAEIVDYLQPALCDSGGHWTVDHVRLRFWAIKPHHGGALHF